MIVLQGSKVTLISAYTDVGGFFSTDRGKGSPGMRHAHKATPTGMKREMKSSVDEEEELLYGDLSEVLRKEARWVENNWLSNPFYSCQLQQYCC